MIQFYLELTNKFDTYRLQQDMSTWKKVESSPELNDDNENDFLTPDLNDIIRIQKVNQKVELGGEECLINPTGFTLLGSNHFNNQVRVRRDSFPETPTLEQLKSTLKHGDTQLTYALILNVSGFFELVPREFISLTLKGPSIVVRNETFGGGNGYVGLEASEDEESCLRLFTENLELWVEHLKYGLINYYSDTGTQENLEDLYAEIKTMKMKFEQQKLKDLYK